jgi:plasmid stabilization system protein ParE
VQLYLFTADAEHDLAMIRAYLVQQGGKRLAQRILREIRETLRFLGRTPEAGHRREDLTDAPLKFWRSFRI